MKSLLLRIIKTLLRTSKNIVCLQVNIEQIVSNTTLYCLELCGALITLSGFVCFYYHIV